MATLIHDNIISTVAEVYGVSVDDILGKSRKQPIAEARQMAMYILRESGLKYHELRDLFSVASASVIHNVQRMVEVMDIYSDIRDKYNIITNRKS